MNPWPRTCCLNAMLTNEVRALEPQAVDFLLAYCIYLIVKGVDRKWSVWQCLHKCLLTFVRGFNSGGFLHFQLMMMTGTGGGNTGIDFLWIRNLKNPGSNILKHKTEKGPRSLGIHAILLNGWQEQLITAGHGINCRYRDPETLFAFSYPCRQWWYIWTNKRMTWWNGIKDPIDRDGLVGGRFCVFLLKSVLLLRLTSTNKQEFSFFVSSTHCSANLTRIPFSCQFVLFVFLLFLFRFLSFFCFACVDRWWTRRNLPFFFSLIQFCESG